MTPLRIQRSRSRGAKLPPNTVCGDRSTKWGNPFVVGKPGGVYTAKVMDRRHAWQLYLGVAPQNEALVTAARAELRGKNLACWCRLCPVHATGKPLDLVCDDCAPCHADVLGRLVNS